MIGRKQSSSDIQAQYEETERKAAAEEDRAESLDNQASEADADGDHEQAEQWTAEARMAEARARSLRRALSTLADRFEEANRREGAEQHKELVTALESVRKQFRKTAHEGLEPHLAALADKLDELDELTRQSWEIAKQAQRITEQTGAEDDRIRVIQLAEADDFRKRLDRLSKMEPVKDRRGPGLNPQPPARPEFVHWQNGGEADG